MTETPKSTASIVNFPIQIRETDDTTSDAERILQMKLAWAHTFNRIASGEFKPTELQKAQYKEALDDVNIRLRKLGYPPIYHNF